jgi:hypothetical protein
MGSAVGNNRRGREDTDSIVDLAARGEDILTNQLLGTHETQDSSKDEEQREF